MSKSGKEIFFKKERENYFSFFQDRSAFLCNSYYTIYCRTSFSIVIPVKSVKRVAKKFLKKERENYFSIFKTVVPFYVTVIIPYIVEHHFQL